MNVYATLAQIRAYLESSGAEMSTEDDDKLTQYLVWASRLVDRRTRRTFYPRSETRYYDMPYDDGVLVVDDDLLAVSTFTTQNTSTSVDSDDYYLMCGNSYNITPYDRLAMKADGDQPNLLYSGTSQKSQAVTGTWGYHEDWSNAWADSQDTVQDSGGITASATTVAVNDARGMDANGLTPRLSVGHLLKIDDEYLAVTSIKYGASTSTLTVRRGRNGTTAATHDEDTAIYTFSPYPPATTAVLDLTKWIYEHRNEIGGIVALPSLEGTAIEADVAKILAVHQLPVRPS